MNDIEGIWRMTALWMGDSGLYLWKEQEFNTVEEVLGKLSKKNDETYGKFHILGGGSAGGHFPYVITKDFKCTESHFEHF